MLTLVTMALGALAYLVLSFEPTTPSLVQLVVVTAFGVSAATSLRQAGRRAGLLPPEWGKGADWRSNLLAAAFALTWGRLVFIGFFHNDEIGYFFVLQRSLPETLQWVMEPLNEHFQPFLKLLLAVIYNVFGQLYFGLALALFLVALAFFEVLHLWLLTLLGLPISAFALVLLFIVAVNLPDVYQHKAAGLPLLLSLLGLFLCLLQIERWRPNQEAAYARRERRRFEACLLMTVFSSSLISMPLLYLAPFLGAKILNAKAMDRRPLVKYALRVSTTALAASVLYFAARAVLGVPAPRNLSSIDPVAILEMTGAFGLSPVAPVDTMIHLPLGIAILILGIAAIALVRRQKTNLDLKKIELNRLCALAVFGSSIVAIAAAQLFIGRGFKLPGEGWHRYELFPTVGAFCLAALLFPWTEPVLRYVSRLFPKHGFISLRAVTATIVLAMASAGHVRATMLAPWSISLCVDINRNRRGFYDKIDAALCELKRENNRLGYDAHSQFRALPNASLPPAELKAMDLEYRPYPLAFFARVAGSSCYDVHLTPYAPVDSRSALSAADSKDWPRTAELLARYYPGANP